MPADDKKTVILYGVFGDPPAYDRLVVIYPDKLMADSYRATGYDWLYQTRLVSALVDHDIRVQSMETARTYLPLNVTMSMNVTMSTSMGTNFKL
jgi:hypothetical protein